MAGILVAGGMIVFDKAKSKREQKKIAKEAEFENMRKFNAERIDRLKREGSASSEEDDLALAGAVEPPPYSMRDGEAPAYRTEEQGTQMGATPPVAQGTTSKDEKRRSRVLSFPIGRRSRKEELSSHQ